MEAARALSPLAVVEDSDEDFEALSRVLRETTSREGVKRYASGEEALAGLLGEDPRPALILLDLNLPGIRGMDVLTQLKADARLRVVPVVVLSGSSREEDIDAAYEAGANAYLSKPLDYTELRRIVVSLHDFWRIATLPGQSR
ncbi:response regulator [Solirubrobacter phytolaccae]|uniref:Response regulator n=1 Tax=Solirubrobacter phytolaccae TaxID=1404360 RepID=A0A9X3N343_9ACTN|nr:response regulator [Solirubrobacter phytolaccae]MDA0178724.1 response regulator [Solirubrobacter phytolaccae]